MIRSLLSIAVVYKRKGRLQFILTNPEGEISEVRWYRDDVNAMIRFLDSSLDESNGSTEFLHYSCAMLWLAPIFQLRRRMREASRNSISFRSQDRNHHQSAKWERPESAIYLRTSGNSWYIANGTGQSCSTIERKNPSYRLRMYQDPPLSSLTDEPNIATSADFDSFNSGSPLFISHARPTFVTSYMRCSDGQRIKGRNAADPIMGQLLYCISCVN